MGVSIILVYALPNSLDEIQKYHIMMVLSALHNKRLEVNETSVAGGFSRHVRGNPEN